MELVQAQPEPEPEAPPELRATSSDHVHARGGTHCKSESPPRNRRRSLTQTMADSAVAAASATQHAMRTSVAAGTGLKRLDSRRRSAEDITAAEHAADKALSSEVATWLELLPTWHAEDLSKKHRKLVERGVPQEVRPMAWTQIVGNPLGLTRALFETHLAESASSGTPRSGIRKMMNFVFKTMDFVLKMMISEGYRPSAKARAGRKMIDVDLERTFSSEGRFLQQAWTSLRQVLEAFLNYRLELGYVQGMSFLSAVLLIHTDAPGGHGHTAGNADAFPAFCCPANLLRPQPDRILQTVLKLDGVKMTSFNDHAHFEELGAMPQLYLVEWIFTLFAKVLPEEPVGWIWDQILLLGDEHIFKTGLGLLQLLQTKFLAMDDLGAVLMVLKDLEKSHVLAEALFEARDTKDVLFKDLAALKRDRWLSLYRCAEKIKLKPALWKQLLVDLQEFEEQIEEAGERDSALLSLVMALDNLDVDEEEANKIARAMQKGRRNAVATLEFGDTDVAAAAATAAAAAAVQPRTKERRHSLPDVMTPQAEWINVPTSAVRKTLTDAHDSSGEEPDNSSEDEMEAEAPVGHDQRRRPSLPMTAAAVGFAVLVPGALPMAAAAAAASHYHEHHPAEEAETRAAGGGAAGRIRGAADRVRRASVEGIHHLPGMSEGVPPTSQHSPARAAGTEYVMRSLTPELEELLGRCCANSTHNPLPEDLAQLQAVAAKNIGGPLLLPWMRCSLEDGLQSEATPVIVKTLRLLVNLMAHAGGNRENFARRMKADFGGAAGGLERASGYCAVDADHGEKPAALVRKLATQVQALLLGT